MAGPSSRDDGGEPPFQPPPPPPPRSGNAAPFLAAAAAPSTTMAPPPPPPKPHESTIGTFPAMESAPSSANFAMAATTFAQPPPSSTAFAASHPLNFASTGSPVNPLPPPPPRPKIRTKNINSPPRSGNSIGSAGSMTYPFAPTTSENAATVGGLTPPPTLPPPPRVNVTGTSPLPPTPTVAAGTGPTIVSPPPPGQPPAPVAGLPTQTAASPGAEEFAPTLVAPPRLPLVAFADAEDTAGTMAGAVEGDGFSLLARRHTHLPILVIATESANQMAWKNGLQLVDLFQGIVQKDMTFNHANLPPFRSIHKSLFPSNLLIDFVDTTQLQPHSYEDAHSLLQDHAQLKDSDGNIAQELTILEDRVEELLQPMTKADKEEPLGEVTKDAFQLTSPLDIPWLVRYKRALDSTTNALPHELIHAPALVLLVCTTQEVEPPQRVLNELSSNPHIFWPASYSNGVLDPSAVRQEVLVLHDGIEGPPNVDESGLRAVLQRQFGPQSQVLRINTVPPVTALALAEEDETDLWGGGGHFGTRLSANDRVLLRRYFQSLLTSSLLPALERRIATLNAIVSERKKGVRNLVKNFWRKPKEETPSKPPNPNASPTSAAASASTASSAVRYRFDSIESQTRLLGDTLFLMKDYEAALSIYRLIRDDYKADKAYVHYANIQELMALCLYHLDPFLRAKEIFSSLETALLHYTRAAEEERTQMMASKDASARPTSAAHATRLATRLCLVLATASEKLTKGRELEVADLLASASSHESSLGAAVLLEQASAFYFEANLHRKYAFHMLMSGHMFRTANQDHHAFRCFASALYVYRHGGWHELHNHLQSALAAQLFSMQRMSVALLMYARLMAHPGKVSAKSQQKFLVHLLDICRDHAKKALAGADRMGVPRTATTTREREEGRNARLDRIVQVIRFTPKASRVLEIPNLAAPHIDDKSVQVWTHAEGHFLPRNVESVSDKTMTTNPFSTTSKGDEQIWEDLEVQTLAEWKIATKDDNEESGGGLDETVTAALSKIGDKDHRRIIGQIDRENQSRALVARSRKKGSLKPKPTVRAMGEPIGCDFVMTNPLAVDIRLTNVQLVARMVESGTDALCTNEDAIKIGPPLPPDAATSPDWTFAGSPGQKYFMPEFVRIQESNQKTCKSASEAKPFFVVTRQDVSIPAGGCANMSTRLLPLVKGDLEILGVRFQLEDQVWVYHSFHIPGPLLTNTRTNRANRARGESIALKSRIDVELPCLTAELIPQGTSLSPSPSGAGPLLEGQIQNWIMRLSNVGKAPASGVALKTNLPWIALPSTKASSTTKKEREGQATSQCLGPTGTLMRLSLDSGDLQTNGELQPGETCDIAIRVRTSGHGKRPFYMLYRYDLKQAETDSKAKPQTRWLRQMFDTTVFPSLLFSAGVATSSWKDNEQLLSVEMINNRTDQPTNLMITLDKLILASRKYKLEVLPGQFETSPELGNVLQIGWQEKVTIHYRVIPSDEDSPVCLLSETSFVEDAKVSTSECVASDTADFLCLQNAFELFEASWNNHKSELARAEIDPDGGQHPRSIASIRRANTGDSSSMESDDNRRIHPTSIGKLCLPGLSACHVHLICKWRAINGDEVVRGEQHLREVRVRPVSFSEGCPITATASHPQKLEHDFSKGPVIVPVEVTLRNQMVESSVDFVVSIAEQANMDIIGPERLTLSLKASETITLPFDALLSRGGIHDLQSMHLTIQDSEETKEEISHSLDQQWLVHISDSSS